MSIELETTSISVKTVNLERNKSWNSGSNAFYISGKEYLKWIDQERVSIHRNHDKAIVVESRFHNFYSGRDWKVVIGGIRYNEKIGVFFYTKEETKTTQNYQYRYNQNYNKRDETKKYFSL